MINIKQIKYEIDPIEYNFDKVSYDWAMDRAKGWIGLSELNSVPSLFIEHEDHVIAISIQDVKTLINLPAAQLLDTDMSKTTQG